MNDDLEIRWRSKILRMKALGDWKTCKVCKERYWCSVETEKEVCGECAERAEQLALESLE